MSIFKPSTETGLYVPDKILFWGPPGAGKTHVALTWPEPALIDIEIRGRHFADRFGFQHAEIATLAQLATAFKELADAALTCKTIVTDSASAIYYKLVSEHTKLSDKGKHVTDWVTVNRRFLACMNFVFSIAGRSVIFTAHGATKLKRQGEGFVPDGLKFVGDDRFRFAFDYIFRIESKGDPRVSPAVFHVEKSASPSLKIGTAITGLDFDKFRELTAPRAPVAA